MKNMSFFLTTQQFIDGTKDVTRRLGWRTLKSGTHLMAVEKGQGIKAGGLNRLGEIEIINNRPEPLDFIIKYPYRDYFEGKLCPVYISYTEEQIQKLKPVHLTPESPGCCMMCEKQESCGNCEYFDRNYEPHDTTKGICSLDEKERKESEWCGEWDG